MSKKIDGKFPFTEEQWVKFKMEKRLAYVECRECGSKTVIPMGRCKKCGSGELDWKESAGRGKIYTYTITFVPPPQLASIAPYVSAVVELAEGVRLNGIVTGIPNVNSCPDDLVGKDVTLEFQEVEDATVVAFHLEQ
ncbi:MAG: Zn-ribbon domain-containing OB-fold protein [Promethearchaeota archaeon]